MSEPNDAEPRDKPDNPNKPDKPPGKPPGKPPDHVTLTAANLVGSPPTSSLK